MAFAARPRFEWKLRTRTLPLGERTQIMAILNLTPDSFSGDGLGGRGTEAAVQAAGVALGEGADILDVGAESTRPGAQPITADEEQARLLPALWAIRREYPEAILSVDSYHADTAQAAMEAGAEIVNDVAGLRWDDAMAGTVSTSGCGLVLMHTRGRPPEWKQLTKLGSDAVVQHVFEGLVEGLALAEDAGIAAEHIVLDPGFAFGKIGAENFSLLAELSALHPLGRPLLVGLSRKGFLGEAVRAVQAAARAGEPPSQARREATLAGNVAAILAGAHLLRVHDVAITREAAAIADATLAAATRTAASPPA